MQIDFYVQREIVSGLKYQQSVFRRSIKGENFEFTPEQITSLAWPFIQEMNDRILFVYILLHGNKTPKKGEMDTNLL